MVTLLKHRYTAFLGAGFLFLLPTALLAHCQVPCGIYGDEMRVEMLKEHFKTIDKANKQIAELSKAEAPNYNQIVRWVTNKDKHADEMAHIITYYFMAQRIKPSSERSVKVYARYTKELTLLHQLLIASMKAKQGTDSTVVEKGLGLLTQFSQSYFGQVTQVDSHAPDGHDDGLHSHVH